MFKQKLIIALIVIGIILILIYAIRSFGQSSPLNDSVNKTSQPTQITQNDKPQIVSTKPDPLDENIVSTEEIIEITFNRPLENVGEFKVRIEPETDYEVELSGDRKTAKIIPAKPYPLGTTFTLFIGPETKFDGVGRWGKEKVYHFRTIKYTGV